MKSIILLAILIASTRGFAQNSSDSSLEANEKAIRQKIKLKTYPGGFEEEPLKVQMQLNSVTRKMAPVQDVIEETPAAGDTAHD